MVLTRQRAALGAIGAAYIMGATFLAGVAAERIRADRERVTVVRAQEQRKREARAQAMRVELQQEAGRAASRAP